MNPTDLQGISDHLPAWRAAQLGDPDRLAELYAVPEVTPATAAWIETVVDTVIESILGTDRLHRRHREVADPTDGHWLDDALTGLVAALDQRGLRVSGQTHGIDLIDPGSEPTRTLLRCLIAVAEGRAKCASTWENDLISHLLWWRHETYQVAAAAAVAGQDEED